MTFVPAISALSVPLPLPPASISFCATEAPSATPTPVEPPKATAAATAATCASMAELSVAVTITSPALPIVDPTMSAIVLTPIVFIATAPPPAKAMPVVPATPAATAAA